MFINKKSHKSAFVCIAVFMVTMIMILKLLTAQMN